VHNLSDILGLAASERAAALARTFPTCVSTSGFPVAGGGDASASHWEGGRAAAIGRLAAIDPAAYARTRNHVEGVVTRLSPWLRHGVLSLAEVRDAALARVQRPDDAAKLIAELGWRDYWQQVYAAVGSRIRQPIEPPSHTSRVPTLEHVPPDVLAAQTGMQCIDAFVQKLHSTGWLHNHERMWLASWLVHVRGVRWQAGADWFLSHLLDGDPASNHLSWQWVAGTFSAKPYLFNRENLETFTSGVHCEPCGLRGSCPVEGSYEALTARWFAADGPTPREPLRIRPQPTATRGRAAAIHRPLVWLTLDSAAATSPAVMAYPESPRLFVIDPDWLAEERPSLNRLLFLFACLADIQGVEVLLGDPREILPARAGAHGCDGLVLTETPCPRIRRVAAALEAGETGSMAPLPVTFLPWPRFCDRSSVKDLGRFSRYWQQVGTSAMQPTPPL
jgi:deoxyribodipyrimidine photo-lyase